MSKIRIFPSNYATYANTDPEYTLGDTFDYNGCTYMFVQIYGSSANASSAGRVFYETTTPYVVSDDVSAALGKCIAGVGIGTVAKSSYGFILVKGKYSAVLKSTAAAVVGGMNAIPSASDGLAGAQGSTGVALTVKPMGIWLASYSAGATSGSMFVDCL